VWTPLPLKENLIRSCHPRVFVLTGNVHLTIRTSLLRASCLFVKKESSECGPPKFCLLTMRTPSSSDDLVWSRLKSVFISTLNQDLFKRSLIFSQGNPVPFLNCLFEPFLCFDSHLRDDFRPFDGNLREEVLCEVSGLFRYAQKIVS
jgi:hypothetical protein